MKRILSFCLAAALALALVACGKPAGSASATQSTPAVPQDYAKIIQDSRIKEDNEAYSIIGKQTAGELTVLYDPFGTDSADYASQAEMLLGMFSIDSAALDSFALSTTMVNIRAYGVGIFKPAEGKKQAVLDGVNGFVSNQQKAFEQYLQDQYEVAKGAIIEELPSGEILLVMCEGGSDVAANIKAALKA